MSLHPQHLIPPVPKQTARIAQAAFPKDPMRRRTAEPSRVWGPTSLPRRSTS